MKFSSPTSAEDFKMTRSQRLGKKNKNTIPDPQSHQLIKRNNDLNYFVICEKVEMRLPNQNSIQ